MERLASQLSASRRQSAFTSDLPIIGPSANTPKAWHAHRAEIGAIQEPLSCPECGSTGWLRTGESDDSDVRYPFGELVRCATCGGNCRLQWITDNCGLEDSELQVRLHHWQLGNWADPRLTGQRRDALNAIEQAIERRTGFFGFWGDFGSGKTLALQIIVNELRLKLVEVYYAPLAHVLDHVRSLYNSSKASSVFWRRLLDVPVLALDEVTRFYETPWARERLWMLADTRYRRMGSHLTLFATNEDPHEVLPTSEAIGYLYSRLRQGGLIELRGDLREAAGGDA